jgi:hypothetical protein
MVSISASWMDATSGVFSSLKLSASTTPTSGYLIPMNMIKKCCQNFRMIDTSFSNPIQKYLLKYSRNLFYGPTCTHRMSCQPQAINDIFNFDMNDPTSRPWSDIFSVISAGTVSESSFFPTVRTSNSRTVAYEWACESTDNISAFVGKSSHCV